MEFHRNVFVSESVTDTGESLIQSATENIKKLLILLCTVTLGICTKGHVIWLMLLIIKWIWQQALALKYELLTEY